MLFLGELRVSHCSLTETTLPSLRSQPSSKQLRRNRKSSPAREGVFALHFCVTSSLAKSTLPLGGSTRSGGEGIHDLFAANVKSHRPKIGWFDADNSSFFFALPFGSTMPKGTWFCVALLRYELLGEKELLHPAGRPCNAAPGRNLPQVHHYVPVHVKGNHRSQGRTSRFDGSFRRILTRVKLIRTGSNGLQRFRVARFKKSDQFPFARVDRLVRVVNTGSILRKSRS